MLSLHLKLSVLQYVSILFRQHRTYTPLSHLVFLQIRRGDVYIQFNYGALEVMVCAEAYNIIIPSDANTNCWGGFRREDVDWLLKWRNYLFLFIGIPIYILADDNFKCVSLNENDKNPIPISLKFVPRRTINYKPALIRVDWPRTGVKPLLEPILTQFAEAYMRH